MNFTYLLLANFYLCCWLGLYHLLCSKKTTFTLNRYMLLGGYGVAAILPLIAWPSLISTSGPGIITSSSGQAILLETVAEQPASAWPIWTAIVGMYWIGAAVSLSILLWKLFKIRHYTRNFPVRMRDDYVQIITPPQWEVFSFFHYLFAPASVSTSILEHEKVHIRQRHSLDNILTEVLRVFCWFNPMIYRYQKDIKMNHEYLADSATIEIVEIKEYAQKLVSQSFQLSNLSLVHPFFNRSHLQKRLRMLQKNKNSNRRIWTYLILLPALSCIVLTTSSFSLKSKLSGVLAELKPADLPADRSGNAVWDTTIQGTLRTPSGEPVDRATIIIKNSQQGTLTDDQGHFTLKAPVKSVIQISKVGYNSITLQLRSTKKPLDIVLYPKPESLQNVVVVGYNKNPPPPPSPPVPDQQTSGGGKNKVFQFVEQMPSFPGGEAELMKYLSSKVIYPKAAKEKGLGGTVVVQFVVEKSGQITQVQTVGDPNGGGLEEEAMRVIKQMPRWQPGKQNGKPVRVQFNLPIRFVLQ